MCSQLTAGTSSFLTSSTALLILISARVCVSSTVISTCRSSFRCSQFGFPLFCSSWETEREREREMLVAAVTGIFFFFLTGHQTLSQCERVWHFLAIDDSQHYDADSQWVKDCCSLNSKQQLLPQNTLAQAGNLSRIFTTIFTISQLVIMLFRTH